MRLRAVGAVEKRPAAMRHRRRQRYGDTKSDRRDNSRHAVDPGCAGVSGLHRERRAVAHIVQDARQAVSQRSPRSVFQCRCRCGHRIGNVHPSGRGDRPRLLPDQRHPRSSAGCERRARICRSASSRSPAFASAGRRSRARSRRGFRWTQPWSRTATAITTSPAKSTATTGAAPRCDLTGANVMSSVGGDTALRLVRR